MANHAAMMPKLVPVSPQTARSVGVAPRPKPLMLNKGSFPIADINKGSVVKTDEPQRWLQTRFEGLQPQDFFSSGSIVVYSAPWLVAPPGFQQHWRHINEHYRPGGTPSAEELCSLRSAKLVLVVADLRDMEQMRDVKNLGRFIRSLSHEGDKPHVILVQHSVEPCLRGAIDEFTRFRVVTDALRNGIHDTITEETASLKLAWEVQNRLLKRNVAKRDIRDCYLEKDAILQQRDQLEWLVHDVYWDYLRVRKNIDIPAIDTSIDPGIPSKIHGMQVGEFLGEGAAAKVYDLIDNGEVARYVLKATPKSRLTHMRGIEMLHEQVAVMKLLSSDTWKHPNIIKLTDIYHSETHVFFRMEHGGSRNLHKRLKHRENRHSLLGPLTPEKVRSIFSQVSSAICHMHTGPQICHSDIKPENLMLHEMAGDVHVRVVDFDSAIVKPSSACSRIAGTFPFIAPDLFFQDSYDPYAADIWSMAIAFLEVLCCSNVLENALCLHRLPKGAPKAQVKSRDKNVMATIRQYFSDADATDRLVTSHVHPTLKDMKDSVVLTLSAMLNVTSSSRATSTQVAKAFA